MDNGEGGGRMKYKIWMVIIIVLFVRACFGMSEAVIDIDNNPSRIRCYANDPFNHYNYFDIIPHKRSEWVADDRWLKDDGYYRMTNLKTGEQYKLVPVDVKPR